ncbi:MAG: hypothetical protein Q4D56_15160 [Bacteroides sp.]|nr:hypothetical protein [Bacteroides sp.]
MIQRLNQRQKADIRRGFRENPLYQYLNEVCKPYESELPGLRLSPEEVFQEVVAAVDEMRRVPRQREQLCTELWERLYCDLQALMPPVGEVPRQELQEGVSLILSALSFCATVMGKPDAYDLMTLLFIVMEQHYPRHWQFVHERITNDAACNRWMEPLGRWLTAYVEGNTFLTNGYGELGEAQAGRADEARTLNIYNNAPSHFYNESKFENTRYITGSEPKWLQNLNI